MQVVFVAPYLGASMVHCLDLLCDMEVEVGVISHQPAASFPTAIKRRLAGHFRIDNALDPHQLALAVRAFKAQWGRVDRLLGYLEQLQIPLADARDIEDIPGMRGEVARNFRNKNRMKEVLRRAGLPVARQRLVTEPGDALAFAEEVGFPLVLKPVDGMGSKATQRVSDTAELYAALNRLLPRPGAPVQCEEFITGDEHTCETAFIGGKPVWRSSTSYLPGPLKVLENPWMQYCVLLERETPPHVERFAPLNTAALRALGMETGISHMEWFLREDGRPLINEVGARPPGVNIMRLNSVATGHDMWQAWLDIEVHHRWTMPSERRCAAGCAFLRGQGRGRRVVEVTGVEALQATLGDALVEARWPRPGQPRSNTYEGEGWVIVRGSTTDDALEALRATITTVRVVLGS